MDRAPNFVRPEQTLSFRAEVSINGLEVSAAGRTFIVRSGFTIFGRKASAPDRSLYFPVPFSVFQEKFSFLN